VCIRRAFSYVADSRRDSVFPYFEKWGVTVSLPYFISIARAKKKISLTLLIPFHRGEEDWLLMVLPDHQPEIRRQLCATREPHIWFESRNNFHHHLSSRAILKSLRLMIPNLHTRYAYTRFQLTRLKPFPSLGVSFQRKFLLRQSIFLFTHLGSKK